jgi:hypothetical protein
MAGRSRGLRAVKPYLHGTDRSYEYGGCRCDDCRAAHAERVKRNRAERLAAGNLTHGARSAWDAGCRCPECRTVHNAAHADYRARRAQAALADTG